MLLLLGVGGSVGGLADRLFEGVVVWLLCIFVISELQLKIF